MSNRPKPTQKQMILQQLMLAVAVFMAAQLMCGRPKGPSIVGVSATIPAVVHTNIEHRELEGAPVYIHGLVGVPDGDYFAKVSAFDAFHFGLFSDHSLKTPVASNSVAISDDAIWLRPSAAILGDINNPLSGSPPPATHEGEQWEASKGSVYWANARLYWSTLNTTIGKAYIEQLKKEEEDQVAALRKHGAPADQIKQTEQSWADSIKVEQLRVDILAVDGAYKYA